MELIDKATVVAAVKTIYNEDYKQGYNDAIDEACKWLKYNFNMPDDFEAHLKQAMELCYKKKSKKQ